MSRILLRAVLITTNAETSLARSRRSNAAIGCATPQPKSIAQGGK